jgi:hypothetical protein
MAVRQKHRTKLTDPSDRQVPINGALLAEVMRERRTSPRRLASQVQTSAQNIEHMVKSGANRKCRAGLRTRIATQLGISEALLAGEPVVYPGGLLTHPGFEYRYSLRTELMASRLLTKVAEACVRDLQREDPNTEVDPAHPSVQEIVESVVGAVAELIRVKEWRQRLMVWRPGIEQGRGYTEPATASSEVTAVGLTRPPRQKGVLWPRHARIVQWQRQVLPVVDSDHEEGVLALIRGVEHLLKPWFEDKARIHYEALSRLTAFTAWADESYGSDPLAPAAINPGPATTMILPARRKSKPKVRSKRPPVKKSTAKRRAR